MKAKQTTLWWQYSVDTICQKLKAHSQQGLLSADAAKRLAQCGANQLPERARGTALILLLKQFANVLVWVLIGALVIAAALGEWGNVLAIASILAANAIIGFFQEYKAERALGALRKLTQPTVRVMRGGMVQVVPSNEIVPGDLVVLEAGSAVPADGRIVYAAQLITQEAALTGESMPVAKTVDVLPASNVALGDRTNMVFMGTVIVGGKGAMIVTETGLNTELGAIAHLLQVTEEEQTPLQVQLARLGRQLGVVCLVTVAIIFVLGVARGYAVIDMLLNALSLAVAAIPEGLPAVVTITLALGVQRMVKRHALVRRLPSVETLGCVTVICTDKTGTLTQNEMAVRAIWVDQRVIEVTGVGYAPQGTFSCAEIAINPADKPDLMQALTIGVLCNDATLQHMGGRWQVVGDPTEGALLTVAAKAGLDKQTLEQAHALMMEVPFDSERKMMSMMRKTPDGMHRLFVKGAPDVVIEQATTMLVGGKLVPLTAELRAQALEANNQLAGRALRVLGLAYRDVVTYDKSGPRITSGATSTNFCNTKQQVLSTVTPAEAGAQAFENTLQRLDPGLRRDDGGGEQDLVFVGLIAMMDPPRSEVKKAIEVCKQAGIKAVMITGDHKETAVAVAQELGMMDSVGAAITGTELDAMSDADLRKQVKDIVVYARTTAEHKMRIIKAFKSHGEVVAMTGDGVNDAPAVKAADIGVAMGIMGTEVTKEAAAMIITDDNFASIVAAVAEGRGIYDNIVKFVDYLLSSNIAELLIIFIGALIGFKDPAGKPFIALLPIHLLWLNLVTDGLPAIALGLDPLDKRAMQRPPRRISESILSGRFAVQLVTMGVVLTFGALGACYVGLRTSAALGHTMVLTMLVVLELIRVQMIRSEYCIGLFSNLWLVGALASSLVLQVMIIYVAPLQKIFKTVGLGFVEWSVIVGIAVVVWLMGSVVQILFRK